MPTNETCFCVVDRIEGSTAVLLLDSGKTLGVPLTELPAGTREGAVLRIVYDDGVMDWSTARIDKAETARRKQKAADILKSLRRRDPGGDIVI